MFGGGYGVWGDGWAHYGGGGEGLLRVCRRGVFGGGVWGRVGTVFLVLLFAGGHLLSRVWEPRGEEGVGVGVWGAAAACRGAMSLGVPGLGGER